MKTIAWILRILLFVILLIFAVKNDHLVVLKSFFGQQWQVQLIVVILIAFSVGVGFGVIFPLAGMLRYRQKISRLSKRVEHYEKLDVQHPPPRNRTDDVLTTD